jgi:hypothetical protein
MPLFLHPAATAVLVFHLKTILGPIVFMIGWTSTSWNAAVSVTPTVLLTA